MSGLSSILGRYRDVSEPLRSERRLELALLCLLALLGLSLLYNLSRLATLAAPEAVLPTPDSLQVASVARWQPISDAESAEIAERPLFWQSRRPLDAVPGDAQAATAGDQVGNIDKLKLVGVFGDGRSAGIIALVRGKRQRVLVGEQAEGWTLESVALDRVVFSKAGESREVVLNRGAAATGKQPNNKAET